MPEYDEDTIDNRFDLYGALYVACAEYHSGQSSRGYRLLSKLTRAGYKPSPMLMNTDYEWESERQADYYHEIVANYEGKL